MSTNIRISIYVGISFLISFGILILFLEMYSDGLSATEQNETVEIGVANKIFLLGTSYVVTLNSSHIQHNLHENGFSVNTYIPEVREIIPTLEHIDDIISNKPKLVVYGIGFRDIGFLDDKQCTFSHIPLYEIKHHSFDNTQLDLQNDTEQKTLNIIYQNPKHATIDVLETLLGSSKTQFVNSEESVSAKINLNTYGPTEIRSIHDLNKIDPKTYCMDFDYRDGALDSLDKIFTKLKENEIDTIVFIPPYTKAYLERISPSLRSDLSYNIKTISEKHDFAFFDFSSKFENLDIFYDHTHVAHNPKSLVYSEEIASLIMAKLSDDFTPRNVKLNSNLSEMDLSGADLRFANLSEMDLSGADLRFANLYGANLYKTKLESADLTNAILANVNLTGSDLSGTILTGADLTGTILTGADLSGATLAGADLSDTILTGVDLSGKDLTGTVFMNAKLTDVRLNKVNAIDSDFSYALINNGVLTQGTFTNADFAHATLSQSEVLGAIMTNSDFSHTYIMDTNFQGTILISSNFSDSNIIDSVLSFTDMSNSNMTNIILNNTKITHANFDSAIFEYQSLLNMKLDCINHHICQ